MSKIERALIIAQIMMIKNVAPTPENCKPYETMSKKQLMIAFEAALKA